MALKDIKCVPCEGGTPPLTNSEIKKYMGQLKKPWEVIDPENGSKKIRKKFEFKDFKEAMVFVNKIAKVAEEQGHHPDMYIFYNKVRFDLTTHAINGLSKNDFIMAARIDELAKK